MSDVIVVSAQNSAKVAQVVLMSGPLAVIGRARLHTEIQHDQMNDIALEEIGITTIRGEEEEVNHFFESS